MQRKIKFRIWDYCAGAFVDHGDALEIYDCGFDGEVEYQQFTGFKDKNGRRVFEGDIVKYSIEYKPTEYINKIFEVIWDAFYGCWAFAEDGQSLAHTGYKFLYVDVSGEVVGNIFENPELLKK
jgi:uncharacterized phage protein (TIGR01671 family)